MAMSDYRAAQRPEPEFAGAWGLWCDNPGRWMEVIYRNEREATDMLAHLIEAERRRNLQR
jgi:hypothetical protein